MENSIAHQIIMAKATDVVAIALALDTCMALTLYDFSFGSGLAFGFADSLLAPAFMAH